MENKSGNISETRRPKDRWKVPSPTPHDLLFPKIGGSQPLPQTQNSNRYYLRNGTSIWPIRTFRGSIRTKAH